MKNICFFIATILIFSSLGFLIDDDEKKHGYIGTDACGVCHKTEKQGKQLDIWKNSKHSKAYETLLTEEADRIAKSMGESTPASKNEKCLRCHTSGYNVDAKLIGKKFKIEDGVQCETCHGSGSEYKDIKVMKSRGEAISKGLIVHEDKLKFCTDCHNAESPTFVAFNFEEQWEKIKHYVPKK